MNDKAADLIIMKQNKFLYTMEKTMKCSLTMSGPITEERERMLFGALRSQIYRNSNNNIYHSYSERQSLNNINSIFKCLEIP